MRSQEWEDALKLERHEQMDWEATLWRGFPFRISSSIGEVQFPE
jgi:hypothetical protein